MTEASPPTITQGVRAVTVAAQAKINLRLRILAREAGGFHQLETLFLRLALSDTVRVRRTDGARSLDVGGEVDAGALGPVESNLAWRAAARYLDATGLAGGFAIELEKRIPVGGGLGGGSADAGAVLRALDAMAESPLGEERLLQIAATLGADVPFLTSGHAYALAWGRGERMLALQPPPARDVVLCVPSFGVNTAAAYGWLAERRASGDDGGAEALVLQMEGLSDWDTLAAIAANDFEPVVAARHPEIAAIVAAMRQGGCVPAMMSGSGSTVFGVVPVGKSFGSVALEGFAQSGGRMVRTKSATRVEPVSPLH